MRLPAVTSLLLLAGCKSTAERCLAIQREATASAIYENASPADQAKLRELGGNAPPRPSDQRWYEEHCFEGLPR